MASDRQPASQDLADLEERVRAARKAFVTYYARCFWSWPRDTVVTADLLPNVAHALRSYGGRREWILSETICPSTLYRAKYLPRFEPGGTPTAT